MITKENNKLQNVCIDEKQRLLQNFGMERGKHKIIINVTHLEVLLKFSN